MKFIPVVSMIMVLFQPCKKSNESVLIKGKVVHRSCASIVVSVSDPQYYHLGQDNWQQSPDKPTYQHVFAVENTCSFPGNSGEGKEITFSVIKNDPLQKDCVVCMLWDNPPAKKQLIRVH